MDPPEITGSIPSSGGGHSAGCRSLIIVFLLVALLIAGFVALVGWAIRGIG